MVKLKSKKTIIIIIAVFVLVVLAAGRIYGNLDKSATTEEDEGVAVETTAVQMGTIEETTTLKGSLEGGKEVDVSPQTSGTVQYIGVAVGDYVYAGQTICAIDNSNYQANLVQAQANYNAALANANNAKSTLSKMQALYAEGAVSKQQVEQAQLAVDTSGVDAAAAQVQAAQQQIKNCTVSAPISGQVAAVNVQQGGMASTGGPVVRLVTVDDVKIKANVTESNINSVQQGKTLNVKIEAASEYDFVGKITSVAPAADPQTNTYPVEITISNASGLLKPGMFAEAELVTKQSKNVLIVPAEAVNTDNCVYVLQPDNTVKKVEVEVGISNENYVEILSGLEIGEVIVTTGQHLLYDGALVRDVTNLNTTDSVDKQQEQSDSEETPAE
ncbi:MAG: efflux RND transporter periplasmic adaptor subunit [Bacillota bacterium]|jgi:RND family efflux transporter MFP subunit